MKIIKLVEVEKEGALETGSLEGLAGGLLCFGSQRVCCARGCGGGVLECEVLHFEPVTCVLRVGLGPPAPGAATCFWLEGGQEERDSLGPSALRPCGSQGWKSSRRSVSAG